MWGHIEIIKGGYNTPHVRRTVLRQRKLHLDHTATKGNCCQNQLQIIQIAKQVRPLGSFSSFEKLFYPEF